MNRLVPFVVLIAALGTGCRRAPSTAQSTTAGTKPAAASTPAPPTTPAATPAGSPAGAPSSAAAAEAPVKPVPAVLPEVVARVNGEKIERWELESAVKQAEANAGAAVPAEQRDRVLRSVLDEVVTYHMLAQESRAEQLTVTDAELDAHLKMIRDMFPTEEAFQQALLLRALTPDRLRQQERRALAYQKLLQIQVESKVSVPDAEVDTFYKENLDKFKQGETIHASHIFLPVAKGATPAQKKEVRGRAEQALKEVKQGGDFAAVAKKYSDDTTAENGGDLGFFGKGDLPPDFEAVAFAMKPGQTSDVVELGAGYHIIRVLERRAPRTAPLEEVRNDVKAFLVQGRRQARMEEFLKGLKAKTKIEILV